MRAAATFAFGAGLLATVNPCGFPMLPSFLSLYLGSSDSGERSLLARGTQGFRVGLALTAGFAGVFVLAGLILSIGLQSFIRVIPWAAAVIAIVLVVVGMAMLCGRHVGLTAASRIRLDNGRYDGYRRVVIFGAGYAVASLSCTVAVFLVVVSQAVAASNPLRILVVFGSYAAGTATMLVAVSISVALAKALVARAVRWLAPLVGRIAGALLVASGVYLMIYWLPTLRGARGAATPGVVRFMERLSSSVASILTANTGFFLVLMAVLAIVGVAFLLAARARDERGS